MIEKLTLPGDKAIVMMSDEIAYKNYPAWYGEMAYKPLTLSIIKQKEIGKPLPLLVWVVGGSWERMNKNVWLPELTDFARAGYAVACVEYRVNSQAPFPAQIEDVKAAIRFLRAHAAELGLDPRRVALMGESAGGHIAAMTALLNGPEYDVGDWLNQSSAVSAVVDWYGPSDLNRLDLVADDALSPESHLIGCDKRKFPDKAAFASPVNHVRRDAPPFLLLHGNADTLVPIEQSRLLYDGLIACGAQADLIEVESAIHADPRFVDPAMKKRILEFLDQNVKT